MLKMGEAREKLKAMKSADLIEITKKAGEIFLNDDLPIGVDGISGKKPAEIAVSVAAEVLKLRELASEVAVAEYPANVHPIGR